MVGQWSLTPVMSSRSCGPVKPFEPVFGEGMRELPLFGPLVFGQDCVVQTSWVQVALAVFSTRSDQ